MGSSKGPRMSQTTLPTKNFCIALGLITLGLALGAAGVYVGETDDAPGAALMGFAFLAGLVALGLKTARRRR